MPIPIRWSVSRQAFFKSILYPAVILTVTTTLAGCSLLSEPDDAVSANERGVSSGAAPDEEPVVAASARSAPLPMRKPSDAPSAAAHVMPDLMGHGQPDVLSALGEPQTRDISHPVQRWRYAGAHCALELLFFFDIASDRYRLAMIQRDGREVETAQASGCLAPAAAKPVTLS